MKEHEEKKQWVLCPWCGSKTRIINAKNFTIETKEARR